MTKGKINDRKLKQMLREGKSKKHCAAHFNCSVSAIDQRIRKLEIVVSKDLVMNVKRAEKVAEESFDAVAQLKRIHKSATDSLAKLEGVMSGKVDPKELQPLLSGKTSVAEAHVKYLAEVRKQLDLSHNIFRSLYDMRQVQKFQQVVIEELQQADPTLAKRVIDRLAVRSVVNSSLALT
ncbi:hypothetical protein SAMN06295888_10278 [Desulfonatronum zhilinae]|nr:hypothetical protein SAMN06295888_10278 [Desulfonatronum zhilinae]